MAVNAIISPFLWGEGGQKLTPEELARQRKVADALFSRKNPAFQNAGWLGAIGQGLEGAIDGWEDRRLDRAESANKDEAGRISKSVLEALTGPQASAATSGVAQELSASSPAPSASGMGSYRDAIASIESAGSGDYAAVGATHPKLGRALGRYQVMESNIAPWSQEALGRAITADEFMADPTLQDAIFDNQFGKYVQKYGPEGAAQAWFGGPGGVGKTNRKDSLGTTIGGYTDKFRNALGGTEVASLGPAGAIDAIAPPSGAVAPEQPVFDAGRFSDPIKLAEMPAGLDDMAARLGTQASSFAPALPPATTVAPAPAVASPQAAASPAPSVAQALMAPAPVQVAQAQPARSAPALNPAIVEALSSPYADEGTKRIAGLLFQQHMEQQQHASDPMRALQIQKAQQDIAAGASGNWAKLDDGRLYNQRTGETQDVPLAPGAPTGEKYFGNPIAIQTPQGVKYGQIGDKGGFKEIQIGEGNTFAPPTKTIDTETEQLIYDNFGNLLSRVPKQNREKARETAIGTAEGKSSAEARSALASTRLVGKQITDQIESVLNDPNLDGAVGAFQGRMPSFRQGSINFDKKLEQLQSQSFLQAREFLKGQGPITDYESRKAETAIAQLSTAQSEDQFRQALRDFKDAVASGVQKAELAAGGGGSPSGPVSIGGYKIEQVD